MKRPPTTPKHQATAHTKENTQALDELEMETMAYFEDVIYLGDAPLCLLNEIYHAEQTFEADIDPDMSFATTTQTDINVESEANLFTDGLDIDKLRSLLGLLKRWKELKSDHFWRIMTMTARRPALLSDAFTTKKRAKRRSSIRQSLSANGSPDLAAKCLVALFHRIMSRANEGHSVPLGYMAALCFLQLFSLPGQAGFNHIFPPIVLHDLIRLMSNLHHLLFAVVSDADQEDEYTDEEALPGFESRRVLKRNTVTAVTESELQTSILGHAWLLITEVNKSIEYFDLKNQELRQLFVAMLVEVLQLGSDPSVQKMSKNLPCVDKIMEEASVCLKMIAQAEYGRRDEVLTEIYASLTPVILMSRAIQSTSVPKLVLRQNELAIQLVVEVTNDLVRNQIKPDSMEIENEEVVVDSKILKSYILAQTIAVSFADKSDFRDRAVQNIIQILGVLSLQLRHRFVCWLGLLANNPKNSLRGFVVEICEQTLFQSNFTTSDDLKGMLVERILYCMFDKSPTVRARALNAISAILKFNQESSSYNCAKQIYLLLLEPKENAPKYFAMCIDSIKDGKSAVRKASLAVAKSVIDYHLKYKLEANMDPCFERPISELIDLVSYRFRDPVMTIRKTAVKIMTELLLVHFGELNLWDKWKLAVFSSCLDNETAVQNECNNSVFEVLSNQNNGFRSNLLSALENVSLHDCNLLRISLNRALKTSKLPDRAFDWLISLTLSDDQKIPKGIWALLFIVASSVGHEICTAKLVKKWISLVESECDDPSIEMATNVAHLMISRMKPPVLKQFQDSLKRKLACFSFRFSVIPIAIKAFCSSHSGNNPLEGIENLENSCEEIIIEYTSHGGDTSTDRIVRVLVTTGEIFMVNKGKYKESVLSSLQLIVASQEGYPTKVKAMAFLCLGKLCLVNEDVAKNHISAFARELETSKERSIRNNILVVLGDLCRRYTRVVDQYIPIMANCLKDSDKQLRWQSLIILTNLLHEDYIKWKGTFFFAYLVATNDSDPQIAQFAKDSLIQMLPKHPLLFFSNFEDCIYFFNDYIGGKVEIFFGRGIVERRLFSLRANANAKNRKMIYCYLLKNMPEDLRFRLIRKLCLGILQAVADGQISVQDENGANVFTDTLDILRSEDIKCFAKAHKVDNDNDEVDDEKDAAQAKIAVLSSKLHTQISKKIAIENIIPVVVQLKHRMEHQRSPLLKDVMLYLRELMEDYRDEIEDLLTGDRQLIQEMEFDLRKLEMSDKRSAKAPLSQHANEGMSDSASNLPKMQSDILVDSLKDNKENENMIHSSPTAPSNVLEKEQKRLSWNIAPPKRKVASQRSKRNRVKAHVESDED